MCLKVFEWETIIIGNKCNGKDCKKLLEHVRKYSILSIRLTPMKMRFSLPEKGKLTLFKTMEDLLSEMQDGNSTQPTHETFIV